MADIKLFLAYSSSNIDQNWLESLTLSLKKQGVKIRTDKDIENSKGSIREIIEKNLRGSDFIVYIMNDQDIMEANFMFLAGVAIAGDKPLIAIEPKENRHKKSIKKRIHRFPISNQNCIYIKQSDWPEQTAHELIDVYNTLKNSNTLEKSIAT